MLPWPRLKAKFSHHNVKKIDEISIADVLQMSLCNNFLIRNEAVYFPFSRQNVANEDLFEVLDAINNHMTMCINWKATITDNDRVLRTGVGQHFVQIKNIFET